LLTPREREVMAGVVSGLLNKQIAAQPGKTEKTAKFHRAHIMHKGDQFFGRVGPNGRKSGDVSTTPEYAWRRLGSWSSNWTGQQDPYSARKSPLTSIVQRPLF
jgi:hypothetical protein